MKLKALVEYLKTLDQDLDVEYSNEYTTCGLKLVLEEKRNTLYFSGPMDELDPIKHKIILREDN